MLSISVKEMEEACYEITTAQRLRSSRNACGREEVFDKVRAVSAYPAPPHKESRIKMPSWKRRWCLWGQKDRSMKQGNSKK